MQINLPPYLVFPQLTDNSLSLRAVAREDIPELVEISFYDGVPASSIEDAWMMQQHIDQDYINGNSIHWVIVDKSSHTIVGTCGYYRGFNQNTGELGFILKAGHQGNGYMTQALQLAIDFGISKMNLFKIIAITSVSNHSAIKLMNRLGFQPSSDDEGVFTFLYLPK